jgi:hypothetical protein
LKTLREGEAGMSDNEVMIIEDIQSRIFTLRGVQVMLDSDLAVCYGVEIKRLNEQVKRNIERFPENFRFQLSQEEFNLLRSQNATIEMDRSLRSQIVTIESGRGRSFL